MHSGAQPSLNAWGGVDLLLACCAGALLFVCCARRFPPNINLFSAMVGVGTQVLVITLCVFMLSLVGMFYPYNRGAMLSACVVLYALTAGISGEPQNSHWEGGSRCPAVLAATAFAVRSLLFASNAAPNSWTWFGLCVTCLS